MPEIPSASELTSLASLLAPGFIILGIRARFKEGPIPELKDKVLSYAVASTAYYAAASPLFHANNGLLIPPWLWQLIQFFALPVLVGTIIVFVDQSEVFYKWSSKFGLKLTHHIPAAWDFAFSKIRKGTYVLVKLNDGTRYAGVMGRMSFASSASAERDLFIEEVWSVEKQGSWKVVEPRRSVLLCGKDIRWVEIFKRSES